MANGCWLLVAGCWLLVTMLISEKLQQFYIENNLSEDGGENDAYFYLTFKLFSIKLPNSDFRKKVVHIHDIQHILYNKDITWKGEAFIAGWEIATGIWKHFPINLMSLWAMGFGFLIHPKEVLKGYKKGLQVKGVIDLQIPKEESCYFCILYSTVMLIGSLYSVATGIPLFKAG